MNNRLKVTGIWIYCFIGIVFSACNDAEQFKQTLDDLPQISNTNAYKYKSAYSVGETMVITGFLYPEKNLKITIGGVEAPLLEEYIGNIKVTPPHGEEYTLNQVSVKITEEMGVGANRPVTVTTAGNTIQGASIEIYALGGEGSFDRPLSLQEIIRFNTNQRQNIYFYCVNGKGTVYYFDNTSKDLRRLRKGETEPEILLTATQLRTDQDGTFTLSRFLAGGVNPQETKAWVSLQTSASTQVSFTEIDLENKTLERLNISTEIAPPYTGNIGEVNLKASGIYPDNTGNVYLYVGPASSAPQDGSAASRALAVAKYNSDTQQVEYIFRTPNTVSQYRDLPGVMLPVSIGNSPFTLYLSPGEAVLYVFYQKRVSGPSGAIEDITAQAVLNLNSRMNILNFIPTNFERDFNSFLGPFEVVKFAYDFGGSSGYLPQAATNFGFMPLPGLRTLFLLYQEKPKNATQYFPSASFPRWLAADFKERRIYQYHTGRFEQGGYALSSATARPDQLLNYDEEGYLYMTANERSVLVKTK